MLTLFMSISAGVNWTLRRDDPRGRLSEFDLGSKYSTHRTQSIDLGPSSIPNWSPQLLQPELPKGPKDFKWLWGLETANYDAHLL